MHANAYRRRTCCVLSYSLCQLHWFHVVEHLDTLVMLSTLYKVGVCLKLAHSLQSLVTSMGSHCLYEVYHTSLRQEIRYFQELSYVQSLSAICDCCYFENDEMCYSRRPFCVASTFTSKQYSDCRAHTWQLVPEYSRHDLGYAQQDWQQMTVSYIEVLTKRWTAPQS